MRSSISLTCTFKEWAKTCQESSLGPFPTTKIKTLHVSKNVEASGGRIAVRVTSDFYCLIDDSERDLDNGRHADL